MRQKGELIWYGIIGIIFLAIIMVFLVIYFNGFGERYSVCGDGTFEGDCSLNSPYFCSKGILIEKASYCGCPDVLSYKKDSCVSQYQTNPKTISMNYTLNGVSKKLNFVVYKGLADYLYNLPVSLSGNVSRLDFKLRNINNPEQRELLMPLVIAIQNSEKDEVNQTRIAISLVQNIPYNSSGKPLKFVASDGSEYSRYPYETLYDFSGVCGEKTELLVFLLKELGYGTADIYYGYENHEAAGIKCPVSESMNKSGYCFIETTGPAILSNDKEEYSGFGRLISNPDIFIISEGKSLGDIGEYADAEEWIKLDREIKTKKQEMSLSDFQKWKNLVKKYGLEIPSILKEIVKQLNEK